MSVLKLQILRAEGENWDNSVLGCYISLNNELLDVITPLNSQHESNQIKVPTRGSLKLYLKTMGDSSKFLGNVSLPLEILPSKGYVWLPLSPSITENFIVKIPEEITGAKVLLAINDEAKIESIKEDFPLSINQDLVIQLNQLQNMIKQETLTRQEIQKNYGELLLTHQKSCANSEARELSLIRLLEQKDQEMREMRNCVEKVLAENKNFEFERENLKRKIEELQSFDFSLVFKRLTEELEENKKMLLESIRQRNILCGQLGISEGDGINFLVSQQDKKFIGLKAEIIKYDEENKHLRMKLIQYEKLKDSLNSQIFDLEQRIDLNKSEGKDQGMIKFANIDALLSKQGFLNLFRKVTWCYEIGEKIVQIFAEENKLIVKYSGQSFTVEEFVKFYVGGEDSKGSRRKLSRVGFKNENSDSDRINKRLCGEDAKGLKNKKKGPGLLRDRNREASVEYKG